MENYGRYLNLYNILKSNSFFLFGPRGTGKSYWIAQNIPETVFKVNLLDTDALLRYARRPRQLGDDLPSNAKYVVIDEIQKCPNLLDEVHRLIESKKIHFLMTGSSARKLKRERDVNLLAGRAWEANFFPLTYFEQKEPQLVDILNWGGLPRVLNSKNKKEELKAYVQMYLQEEIKNEAIVRKFDQFARFFETIGLLNGKELEYQSIANDAAVAPRTIANYVEVLRDTLVAFELKPFVYTKSRKAIARSKFYFFDLGVARFLSKQSVFEEKSIAFGDAFEHFMILEVRAMLSLFRKDADLYFWRSKNGQEVDLIVNREMAVEFKATSQVLPKHLKGLAALKEEGLVKEYFLVSLDPNERTTDGIKIIFWKNFLRKIEQENFDSEFCFKLK